MSRLDPAPVRQGEFLLDQSDQQKMLPATSTLNNEFNLKPVISSFADGPKVVAGGSQLNQTGNK